MGTQLYFLVDMIKNRINKNYQIIKENEEVIKNILVQPNVENRSEIISRSNIINSKLLDENIDLIRIQGELVEKLNKFKEVVIYLMDKLSELGDREDLEHISSINYQTEKYSILLDDKNNTDEQVFVQTIKGELVYESSHPKYDDSGFFEKLFNYYKDAEYYEMCNHLLLLKGKR